MPSLGNDLAHDIHCEFAMDPVQVVAGGGGDGQPQEGLAMDMQHEGGFESNFFLINHVGLIMDEANAVQAYLKIYDSDDGVFFDQPLIDLGLCAEFEVEAGPSLFRWTTKHAVPKGSKRYVRVQLTYEFDAADTDLVIPEAILVRGYGARPTDDEAQYVAPT